MKKGLIGTISAISGICIGAAAQHIYESVFKKNINSPMEEKLKSYYDTLNGWLRLNQQGKSIEQYLLSQGYQTVAIYAMGEIGNRLYDELKNSAITVAYAIDQNLDINHDNLKVITKDEPLDSVDAIIVSIGFAYADVKKELDRKISCPILSLQEIVYEACFEEI